jgi:hypothetical protein
MVVNSTRQRYETHFEVTIKVGGKIICVKEHVSVCTVLRISPLG